MAAEDLERTIDELNAAMQALVAAINPAAAATLEKTKADRDAIAEAKKLRDDEKAKKKAAADKAQKDEEDKQKKIKELGIEGATQLAKVFTSAAGAMYKGEKGMKAFGGSVDAAAGSMIALVGVVTLLTGGSNLLAAGLTAAIAGTAAYVKAAAEQSDKLYDAFQHMSRAGAVGADGLQGVYNDMQKFGLGIQDLDKMTELLRSNSQGLAQFGGTVFQGRKEFANVSKGMEKYRESLMNAGLSQDEQNEAIAGYIRLQSRLGTTQGRSTDELVESSHKYLLEQEALTKVTGLSRKEQESLREKVMAQERFAGKQAELRAQGMGVAAEELQQTFIQLSGAGAEDLAQGFADITAGNLTSAAAIKAYNATNGEALQIAQRVASGQLKSADAVDALRDATERL